MDIAAPALAAMASGNAAARPLRERLRADLAGAMKARDRVAVAVLRPTLAAIENAEAVERSPSADRNLAIEQIPLGVGAAEVERRELAEEQVLAIVRAEVAERQEAALVCAEAGRGERAELLRSEAAVLERYLQAG